MLGVVWSAGASSDTELLAMLRSSDVRQSAGIAYLHANPHLDAARFCDDQSADNVALIHQVTTTRLLTRLLRVRAQASRTAREF